MSVDVELVGLVRGDGCVSFRLRVRLPPSPPGTRAANDNGAREVRDRKPGCTWQPR